MNRLLIPAALFAAMIATPAMTACIDWKAILELHATTSAEIAAEIEADKAAGKESFVFCLRRTRRLDVIHDREDARANKCLPHVR